MNDAQERLFGQRHHLLDTVRGTETGRRKVAAEDIHLDSLLRVTFAYVVHAHLQPAYTAEEKWDEMGDFQAFGGFPSIRPRSDSW